MILLTGASGYIGGELLKLLAAQGRPLRCLTRRASALAHEVPPSVEVVEGDLLNLSTLAAPLHGVHTAYYLAHFLGAGGDFEDKELRAARYFSKAAASAGVQRIVYLGGLGREEEQLSPHLRTRHEVGRILRESGAVTVEFRASIILGGGSLSYRMLQNVVRLMPVIIAYDWVRTRTQPIAADDVLAYLVAALTKPAQSEVFEIGGPERMSYAQLMQRYANTQGLKPLVLPSPIALPLPKLSSSWLNDFAPNEASIALRLLESLKHDTVADTARAGEVFGLAPTPLDTALARAAERPQTAGKGSA